MKVLAVKITSETGEEHFIGVTQQQLDIAKEMDKARLAAIINRYLVFFNPSDISKKPK